jgi:hypothetical protein
MKYPESAEMSKRFLACGWSIGGSVTVAGSRMRINRGPGTELTAFLPRDGKLNCIT